MPRRSFSDTRAPTAAVVAVLCICGTVVSLQQTLVVPLLPDFPTILDTTADNASWLVTVTLLTGAVGTPIISRVADMFGKRLMMLVCLAAVILGSLVAALGDSLAPVIVGRGLQGLGTALIPVGISILRDELPRERVGFAVALMSATLGIGGAVGMPLAGVIYEHGSWPALFWVAGGFAAVMLVAVLLVVPESSVRTRGRFDYVGGVLLSIALTGLLLGISKGGHWGWTSELTIGSFLTAVVVLGIWVPFELRISRPMVDLRTSARKPVLLTNLASVLIGFAMFGNMLATTQQLQMPVATGYGFGLNVIEAGLAMLPGGLSMVVCSPLSAAITRRWGGKTTLITGALVMAVGYVGRVFMTDSLWQIVVGSTVISVGTAIGYAAMPTLIMRAVPITETASANGLNTLLRAIGTSTSSAVVAALLTASVMTVGAATLPSLAAFQHIFWAAAAAALAGAGVASALPRHVRHVQGAEAPVPDGVGSDPAPHEVKGPGREHEVVVNGVVRADDGRPIRNAVISVLRSSGEHVDWSRADNEGAYSVVLPGPGRYVVVSSADGWAPRSEIMEFTDTTAHQPIELHHRLELTGTVHDSAGLGSPAGGSLVSVTRPTGEFLAATHTDEGGHYCMPLPPPGRYILTVVDAEVSRTNSRPIVVMVQSSTVDLELQ